MNIETIEALKAVPDSIVGRNLQTVFQNRNVEDGLEYGNLLVEAYLPEKPGMIEPEEEKARLIAFCEQHPECSYEYEFVPASLQLVPEKKVSRLIFGPLALVCEFLAPYVRIELARIYSNQEAALKELQDCESQTGFENVLEETDLEWTDITDRPEFAWNPLHPGFLWIVNEFNLYRWSNQAMREFCRFWDSIPGIASDDPDSDWKKKVLALAVRYQDPLNWQSEALSNLQRSIRSIVSDGMDKVWSNPEVQALFEEDRTAFNDEIQKEADQIEETVLNESDFS